MPLKHVGFSILAITLLIGCKAPEVTWEPWSETARAKATQAGQPIVLDFYAQWCPPCVEMEQNTFANRDVAAALEGFATFRIDLSKQDGFDPKTLPAAAQQPAKEFGVYSLPTIVFLDANGREIKEARITSYLAPDELLANPAFKKRAP